MILITMPILILFFVQAFTFTWFTFFKLLLTNCVFYSLAILSSEEIYFEYKKDKEEQFYLIKYFFFLTVSLLIPFLLTIGIEFLFSLQQINSTSNVETNIFEIGRPYVLFILINFFKALVMFSTSLVINVSVLYVVVEKINPFLEK